MDGYKRRLDLFFTYHIVWWIIDVSEYLKRGMCNAFGAMNNCLGKLGEHFLKREGGKTWDLQL